MKWELWNTHWKDIFSYLNRQFTRINDYKIIGISVYFTLGLDDVLASFFHRQKTFQLNFVVEKSKLWQKCMYGIYSTKLAFKSELQGSHSVVSCLSRSCIDSVTRTTKSCLTSFLQFELEIEVFVFVQIRPNVVLTLFTGSNSTPDGAPIPLLTKSQLKSL